jgi:hypothetical protein
MCRPDPRLRSPMVLVPFVQLSVGVGTEQLQVRVRESLPGGFPPLEICRSRIASRRDFINKSQS